MGAAQVLRAIAERLVQFAQGDFRATGPPQVLQVLTDELTVIADEAVASVCAGVQPKPPSLAAKQRLLAWVVADARGATVALEKPLALTVGKRLERQAQKVRADLAAAASEAAAARDAARSAGLNDAALAEQLAVIDRAEE